MEFFTPTSFRRRAARALLAIAAVTTSLFAHAQATEPRPASWWTAFGDEGLNSLLAVPPAQVLMSREAQLARETALVSGYMKTRVLSMRLAIAQEAERVEQRQAAMRPPGMVRTVAKAVESHWPLGRTGPEALARQRAAALSELATLLGRPDGGPQLGQLLAPALMQPQLPLPLALPRDVPGMALRLRPDVARAESLLQHANAGPTQEQQRMVGYLQTLAADIQPERARPWQLALPMWWPLADASATMLTQARRDVADKLWHIADSAAQADRKLASVRSLKAERDALALRADAGETDENSLLTAEVALLTSEDQLLQAAGAVSQAWIALQASVGGAGWTD